MTLNILQRKAAIRQSVVENLPPEKPDRLQEKANIARGELGEYRQYSEIKRIIAMGLFLDMTPEELEAYNRANVLAEPFEAGWRLFPAQANAVAAYETTGGLLAPIGVGFGKTLTTLMVANKAYEKGLHKMVLFVPPEVLYQLTHTDIRWARTKVPISYPIHIVGGRDANERRLLSQSNKKGLYIIPYSLLSVKDTTDVLNAIEPKIIIADEAHKISNPSAARTKRIREYIEKHHPEMACLSGTITSKTIRDYYHLARWSLKGNNPLPNTPTLANDWAAIIDAQAGGGVDAPVSRGSAGPLLPLIEWAAAKFPMEAFPETIAGFRKAYQRRLNTAPGVVTSSAASIGTSLILSNKPSVAHEDTAGWPVLDDLMQKVSEQWLTPNGDEIEHAIHTWKWLNELSCGFYNELTWPTPEVYAERKKITLAEAQDILLRAKAHHVAGQDYARALRKWLETSSKPRLDTPMLVGNDMLRHKGRNVGDDLYNLWDYHRSLDFPDRPERDSRAVRVCPYKINLATEWAKDGKPANEGAIIWAYHQEAGEWMYESLVNAGINALHCPAGERHNAAILDPANGKKTIVASIPAHGTGKNLQHFQHQYFLQWPRPAHVAEQVLGRTHRSGQLADELIVVTNCTLEFDQLNFAACLNDALYIHQTTGSRQKLIYASYDPLPKIFPSAVLHERGLQTKLLDRRQEDMLKEKFDG